MAEPLDILVIRFGALGDVINTFPAVRALCARLPAARVSWLVEERCADIVRINRDVAETIVFPRRRWSAMLRRPARWLRLRRESRALFRSLRRRGFGLLLDFQGNLKSGLVARATHIPRRIGFARESGREGNHLFMTERVRPPAMRLPRTEKYLALVRRVVPDADYERPRIRVSDADRSVVSGFFDQMGAPGAPLVGVHPGTSVFGSFKRWPAERFARVAASLRRRTGARTVVTWGPGERELAQQVADASGGAATPAPEMSLAQLPALLERLDVFVASDTGPLHLAAIMGRPVVAIFGPKDPVVYAPYACPSVIVRKDLDCSPCTRRRCPHVRCLLEISEEDVLRAAEQMLGAARI